MALNVVMLGPPGAGKGTQASRLAERRAIQQISTGGILREAMQARTNLGQQVKAIIETGELVSNDIMVGIVRDRLARPDTQAGFVLDGFPRTVPQASALDDILLGRDPRIVVELSVADAELICRLSLRKVCGDCGANHRVDQGLPPTTCERCGGALTFRSDDREDVVRERLKVYQRQTKPVVDFYQTGQTFCRVDGNQPPDDVASAVEAAVEAAMATL